MKIKLSKNKLNERLKIIAKIIERKPTIPSLECFKFETKQEGIQVTGANMLGQIKTFLECEIEDIQEMSFLVNSKTLLDALKELPEQPLIIDIDTNKSDTKIKYHNGIFEFTRLDASDFPNIKNKEEICRISLDKNILAKALKITPKFILDDDFRPAMNGVNLTVKGDNISFAATTGMALVVYEDIIDNAADCDFIIPSKLVHILNSLSLKDNEAIEFIETASNLTVIASDFEITYRLIDAKYPNFRSVIPNHYEMKIVADVEDINSAIKRVSAFSNEENNCIVFNVNGNTLDLETDDKSYLRSANETISIEGYGQLKIGFNAKFLNDAVSVIDTKECVIEFIDERRAAVLRPLDIDTNATMRLLILIMPLVINE